MGAGMAVLTSQILHYQPQWWKEKVAADSGIWGAPAMELDHGDPNYISWFSGTRHTPPTKVDPEGRVWHSGSKKTARKCSGSPSPGQLLDFFYFNWN